MVKKLIFNISAFFSLLIMASIIAILGLIVYFNVPNFYHKADKKFLIQNGLTFREIVTKLHDEGIVRSPTAFLYVSQIIKGHNPKVRYGEYFFEKNLSYDKIMHKISKGYVSFRKVTVAEGLTTHSTLSIIDNAYGLIGEIPKNVAEGTLLPETYFYSYNDTKAATVRRMKASMQRTIDDLWEKRDRSIPVKTKKDAIILASIVERETGTPEERPQVASVFVNRLRKGMRLQSDPTIIYSYTKGDKSLERTIRRKDIDNKSEFNTYHIYGLPPTPICNPGVDSIKAVLNPPTTNYIYFVASGTGGHRFSTNLKQHNQYVAQYLRNIRAQKK
jgi:UPF0755 protein